MIYILYEYSILYHFSSDIMYCELKRLIYIQYHENLTYLLNKISMGYFQTFEIYQFIFIPNKYTK